MGESAEQFGRALVASGLFTAEQVKTLWSALPATERPKDGDALARLLVERGQLTAFQARQLLTGKGSALVMGEYAILDRIGAGGMGQVFKARHRRMERVVALKVMAAKAMQDPAAVQRFQREVKAAARLEHPNIVTAYDAGQAGKLHFLVMQFVDGGDLASLVKNHGPLGIEQAVSCVLQVARGLEHAHAKGIVHRDIKPANLLIDRDGVVKILDMGLARFDSPLGASDEGDGLTATGNIMGTVDYMSPEQALDTHHADARADIYSLGCTLYYLLTGRKLYDADTVMKKLLAHREAPIPALGEARRDVPPSLEAIYQRMVAKRADERYQTMTEVLRALQSVAPGAEESLGETSQFAAGSSSGSASSELKAFLQGLESGTAVTAKRAVTTDAADTFAGDDSFAARSQVAVSREVGQAASIGHRSDRRNPKARLIAGALGGFGVCIAITVWWFNRDNPNPAAPVTDTRSALLPSSAVPRADVQESPPLAVVPFDAAQAHTHQEAWAEYLGVPVETTNSVGMKMVLIPPGEYLMGSPLDAAEKRAAGSDASYRKISYLAEAPQHRVTITRPFYCATTEITVGQFRQFVADTSYRTEAETDGIGGYYRAKDDEAATFDPHMNWTVPGCPSSDDHPVTQVTWGDAVTFCNWLSQREKEPACFEKSPAGQWSLVQRTGYRLPTDAEWEFAARSGDERDWPRPAGVSKVNMVAWNEYTSDGHPQSVGRLLPNHFGLFDTVGNVWEFAHDWFSQSYYAESPAIDPFGPPSGLNHSVRGGAYLSPNVESRVASRRHHDRPNIRNAATGFRVIRELPLSAADGTSTAAAPAPVDLLKLFRSRKDSNGSWEFVDGALIGTKTGTSSTTTRLDYSAPEEYDCEMVIESMPADGHGIVLGFAAGDARFYLLLDYGTGPSCYLGQVDNQRKRTSEGYRLTTGKQHLVRLSVRREGVSVRLDDELLFDNVGPLSALTRDKHPDYETYDESSRFFLKTHGTTRFHRLTLTPVANSTANNEPP